MVKERFAALLEDTGKILHLSIPSDVSSGCAIRSRSGLELLIQADLSSIPRIMICANLGSPTPGFYRENVFREALKYNGQTAPKNGIFAYSQKKDALFLYAELPLEETTPEHLAEVLTSFTHTGEAWKSALDRGQTPSFRENQGAVSSPGGMFGSR